MPPASELSFREKSAWISFVLVSSLLATHASSLAALLSGLARFRTVYRISIFSLVAFVALEIILHIAMAIRTPREALAARDERERLIEMRATRTAFQVLVVGALAGVGSLHLTTSAWTIAQVVWSALLIAETVRFGSQVLYFSRGV